MALLISHVRLVLVGALSFACSSAAPAPHPVAGRASEMTATSARARRLYDEAIVVDMHNDMFTLVMTTPYDPDVRHDAGFVAPATGHTDLPRLVESGITAQFFAAWVDARFARTTPDSSFERAMQYVDRIRAFVARHPDTLLFATTTADVRRAKRERRVAVLIGVEGGHAIEGSVEKLRALHAAGARYLTLTWNNGNTWAGSSLGIDGTSTGGLTDEGRRIVRELNRLGMLVDVSHVSDATFDDVLAVSTDPVIASHSAARALNDHPRNLDDERLRALARSGGVVNVVFFSRFLDPEYLQASERIEPAIEDARNAARVAGGDDAAVARAAIERERTFLAALPRTPLSVLIDHIEHIARVAGVDHVGLGSDFDGVSALPDGLEDVTGVPRIAQALLDRGWSEADVAKVLGGNMLRVMQQVLDRHAVPD